MSFACSLCGGANTTLVTSRLRFGLSGDVRRCGECSLVYLDQSSLQFPADFYETEYHQTYLTHVDPETVDPVRYFEKMQKASRPWIERVNSLLTGREQVLDFGCSTGHLLVGIRDRAARVYGHELSRKEVAFCRGTLGLDVADIPLHERFAPASFDLITLIFVLEHIGEPVRLLTELKRYLKPGGRLVLVVPNALDPLLAFFKIPQFTEFYYCIEHLFYYSPATLARTLEQAGFEGDPEAVQEYPITNHLNWAYRQRPAETLAARSSVPDVELSDGRLSPAWESFWKMMDQRYREFMARNGFSDRVWCTAKVKA